MMQAISTIRWPSSIGLDKPVISQSIQTKFIDFALLDCVESAGVWRDDDDAWMATSKEPKRFVLKYAFARFRDKLYWLW